jgi:hypothetical protein
MWEMSTEIRERGDALLRVRVTKIRLMIDRKASHTNDCRI